MNVPTIILSQLGGNRFLAMTGAKVAAKDPNTLTMRVPGCRQANVVEVRLDPSDTYTMTLYKVRKGAAKLIHQGDGIYAEDLERVFTEQTGLYTRL